jgi:integrase
VSGEGSVYQRADGRWVAKYKDIRGTWRYIYRKSKAEAKKALRQALKDRDDGYLPASKMTVGTFLDSWLVDMRDVVSKRTWVEHESIVRLHLNPTIGTKKLSQLAPDDIRGLYGSKVRSGLKPSRVRRIHVTLRRALKDAVLSRYIRHNPADAVTPPKETQPEINVLTPGQVKHLLSVARGERYECAYVLAAVCGLRTSEIAPLRWEDIDLQVGTLKIRRSVWRGQLQPNKTNSSRRTLKLPKLAIDALDRHHGKKDDSGWLLPTRNGKPVDPTNLHYPWKRMLRKAGLPESTTLHSLRHGAASFLLSQQVPIPVVSKYLGHSNSSITLKVYAHMINDDDGLAGNAIDNVLGESL